MALAGWLTPGGWPGIITDKLGLQNRPPAPLGLSSILIFPGIGGGADLNESLACRFRWPNQLTYPAGGDILLPKGGDLSFLFILPSSSAQNPRERPATDSVPWLGCDPVIVLNEAH